LRYSTRDVCSAFMRRLLCGDGIGVGRSMSSSLLLLLDLVKPLLELSELFSVRLRRLRYGRSPPLLFFHPEPKFGTVEVVVALGPVGAEPVACHVAERDEPREAPHRKAKEHGVEHGGNEAGRDCEA